MRLLLLLACAVLASAMGVSTVSAQMATGVQGFIENRGQWPSEVQYLAIQPGAQVWITKTGVVVDEYSINELTAIRSGIVARTNLQTSPAILTLPNAAPEATYSFFLGNDPSKWITVNVYPSVSSTDGLAGATRRYSIQPDGRVRCEFSQAEAKVVEKSQDVTPTTSVVYGTYLGTKSDDRPTGIRYLTAGDVLVVGHTTSLTFPTVTGGYKTATSGATDGFLVRMDKKLQKVKAYTLIGGNSDDRIRDIAKDELNNFYICGETTSSNFPVTAGVSGQLYKSQLDGFVATIDSTLSKLMMSTYLGGNKDDSPRGIGVNINGTIYVCGSTNSTTNFPVTFPISVTRRDWRGRETTEPGGGANLGQTDGFLTSMSEAGSIIQSRFFGREGIEFFTALAIDGSSGIYVTGSTTSANFETAPTSGFFSSGRLPYDRTFNGGNTDGFVAKFNNELALAKSDDGTYSTYFGGNGEDEVRGVFVDALGRAYVVGVTTSTDLPAIGTLNTTAIGQQDIFLAVLSDDGRELVGTTYFGGTGVDEVIGVEAFTGLTTAFMYGTTSSNDFPTSGPGSVNTRFGSSDGFIAVLNLSSNMFSSLVPGSQDETVRCAAMDPKGDFYYAATTGSADLHTHDSAFASGGNEASMYVAKHAFGTLELTVPRGGESWCLAANQTISWQVAGMQAGEKYVIEISGDGGMSWSVLAKDITGSNYQWKPTAANTPAGETYRVRVSTSRGHVSTCTIFAFVLPPTIATQPKPVTSCEGTKVTLTIEATGGNIRYQWRHAGVNINGATSAAYEIPALSTAAVGNYDCIVTGKCSPTVTSSAAAVSMATTTAITTQPYSVTIKENETLTLSCVAIGSSLTYQWQLSGYNISGATQATFTVAKATKADAGLYRCIVTGACGTATTSDALVVVNDPNGVDNDVLFDGSSLSIVGPNPSSSDVTVSIALPSTKAVSLRLIDQHGSVVYSAPNMYYDEGVSNVVIPVDQLASGVYGLEARLGSETMRATIRVAR